MLALSRKKGEALVISNNIEVTVLEIKGDQVKLGISAPREVPAKGIIRFQNILFLPAEIVLKTVISYYSRKK